MLSGSGRRRPAEDSSGIIRLLSWRVHRRAGAAAEGPSQHLRHICESSLCTLLLSSVLMCRMSNSIRQSSLPHKTAQSHDSCYVSNRQGAVRLVHAGCCSRIHVAFRSATACVLQVDVCIPEARKGPARQLAAALAGTVTGAAADAAVRAPIQAARLGAQLAVPGSRVPDPSAPRTLDVDGGGIL
jgi:hypothetical protein